MHMGPEMIISHNFSYKRKLFAFDMGLDYKICAGCRPTDKRGKA